MPSLYRTLHKALGHAPSALADYVQAFTPNTATGGWHRGDGGESVLGATWHLFAFNDFFTSDGAGGVNALPTQNGILEVGADGNVWWLSGGNGGAQGSRTFPDIIGGRVVWTKGGWPAAADAAFILGSSYSGGALQAHQVMKITGLGTVSPAHDTPVTCGIPLGAGITWGSQPMIHAGYVHLYGINFGTFGMHVCRAPFSATTADYTAAWEVWTGSAWVAGGTSAALTIGSGPLAQFSLVAQNQDYGTLLATSKVFNTAPGFGVPDTWPEIRGWTASNPQGPWTYSGVFYQPTTLTGWYSYAARLERLLGVDRTAALWSLNTDVGFTADIYGVQLADARNQLSGDALGALVLGATASGTVVKSGQAASSVTLAAHGLGTQRTPSGQGGVVNPAEPERPGAVTSASDSALEGGIS